MFQNFELALVTGASSGIGEALSYLFAEKGIDLIIHGRDTARLNKVAEALRSKVKVEIVQADLSDSTERKKVVEKIYERVPDLVVNNAGFGLYGDVLSYETEEQLEILRVDGEAVIELAIEAARAMISAEKKGVIMNVSSSAAFQMFPSFAIYAASKALVNNFTESFDEEIKEHGLRCLATCPGVILTGFQSRASGKDQKRFPMTIPLEFAVKEIWWQIQKGKTIHAFDWRYRFLTFISRLVPRSLLAKSMRVSMKTRISPRPLIKRKL